MENIFDTLRKQRNASSYFYSQSELNAYCDVSDDRLLKEGFLKNQDVFAVISRGARLAANLPYFITKNGEEVNEKDAFYQLFFNSWSNGFNASLEALFVNLLLFGRAYVLKDIESIGFKEQSLKVLPSNKVVPDSNYASFLETPKFYDFHDVKNVKRYTPEQLLIVNFFEPSTNTMANGLSPLQSCWDVVTASNNRTNAEAKLFENRGIAGFVSPKAGNANGGLGLTDRVMKYLKDAFQKTVGGAKNFNKLIPVEEGVDFTPVGMNATDLQLINSRLQHIRDICNIYGAPSLLFNDYQSRTHTNYSEAKKALYTDFVLPNAELFISVFEKDGYKIEIDKASIDALQVDKAQMEAQTLAQFNAGLITEAEARLALGYAETKTL